MSDLTDYAENLLLNWMLTTETVVRPTAWFIALHTADPTEAGNVAEVVVEDDADYARKAITYDAAVGGQCLSAVQVAWTPAVGATAYQVTHISICDAETAGNVLMKGALLVPRTIDNANPLILSIGDIVAALA